MRLRTSLPRPGKVTSLGGAVDELLQLEGARLADDELLGLLQEIELQERRLASVDATLGAELAQRGLASRHSCRDATTLLGLLLSLDPAEAKVRARAAAETGPRQGLSGEPLAPLFPKLAQACASGVVSPSHTRVVTATVDRLPASAATEHGAVETFLTEQAAQFEPCTLARIASRLSDTLDPDGQAAACRPRLGAPGCPHPGPTSP